MSYIQIELGGKKRGFKFNTLALEIVIKNTSNEAITSSMIYAMFYGGLKGNDYVKQQEPDYTFEQVVEWVDELYSNNKEVIKLVSDTFSETQVFKDFLKEFQGDVRSDLKPSGNKKKGKVK